MMRPVPSTVQSFENPASDGHLSEIARIFAAGLLRLHKRGLLAAGPDQRGPKNLPQSGRQGPGSRPRPERTEKSSAVRPPGP